MVKMEESSIASFALPKALFQKVRSVAKVEDFSLSALFRRMTKEWLQKYESDGNKIGGNNMNL